MTQDHISTVVCCGMHMLMLHTYGYNMVSSWWLCIWAHLGSLKPVHLQGKYFQHSTLYRKCEKQNSKDKIQEADQNSLSLLGNNMVFKASAAALEKHGTAYGCMGCSVQVPVLS